MKKSLPNIIPIFPLSGVIYFPKTNLPLNIFEERYIDMVDYSLSKDRIVGMIQYKPNNEIYNVGCYGKITVFNETPDKRYFIKWMKPHAPRGRDGKHGCVFFFRKDLKYVSRA